MFFDKFESLELLLQSVRDNKRRTRDNETDRPDIYETSILRDKKNN